MNGNKRYDIPALEGASITWERSGTPGKLTFETRYKKKYKIVEGNSVLVTVDKKKIFYGFIFTRSFKKDGFVTFTVYDQLRYMKNKETLIYKKKRADEVINIMAIECQLLRITQRFLILYRTVLMIPC